MKVSIVISVFNEQDNLRRLYEELIISLKKIENINYELIFVNDGSVDNSINILKDLVKSDKNVVLVNLARNFGHEIAMTAGLDYTNGECVIFMDSDLQHPPSLLPQMINAWASGKEIVLTKRINNKDTSFFQKVKSRIFYKILNFLSDVHIPSQYPDFRLIDRKYADVVKKMKETNRMFRGLISWLGVTNQLVIDFEAPERFAGKTKYSSRKLISLAIDSIISFSIKPLRIATYLGLLAALFSVLLGIVYIIDFLTDKNYQLTGFGTTIVMVIFIGSVQLIVLGIIGEYLGRIHIEVKNRPLYIAEVFLNESVKEN